MQALELSAQSPDVFLATNHVFRFGNPKFPQLRLPCQRDGQALVVAVVPQCKASFVLIILGIGWRLRGWDDIGGYRSRARVKEEKLNGSVNCNQSTKK